MDNSTLLDSSKQYFAFISYKREDERWATWLHHKLEYYKLPISVRKECPNLPEKIRPIFKDTSELSSGVLAKTIKEGLDNSKFLIVVCSPRAAQSLWVCKEVQEFIDSGREEYIIPFIIGGTPNAQNPVDECFPEGLRKLSGEKELLGININEMGRDAAAVKVVARMFDVRFDTLWQRHEKEKAKRRNFIICLVVAFALAVLAIAGWIWQKNTELMYKNEQIKKQNIALDVKSDSLSIANTSILQQRDELQRAYDALTLTQDTLALTNEQLMSTNENLMVSNTDLLRSQNRIASNRAVDLIDQGRVNEAVVLLQNVVKQCDVTKKEYYLPEFERALRRWYRFQNRSGIHESMRIEGVNGMSCHIADFSNDGSRFYLDTYKSFRCWDTKTGIEIKLQLPLLWDTIEGFNIQTNTLAYTYGKNLLLWDFIKGEPRNSPIELSKEDNLEYCEFSPDGTCLLLQEEDADFVLWDISKVNPVANILSIPKDAYFINYNPKNNKNILTHDDDGQINIWDLKKNNMLHTDFHSFKFVQNFVLDRFIWTPDEEKIVQTADSTMRLYESSTYKQLAFCKVNHKVQDGCFSPDGKYLFTCGFGHELNIWDAETLTPLDSIIPKLDFYSWSEKVVVSPDGTSIAMICGDHVQFYRWRNLSPNRKYMKISPDGTYAINGSQGYKKMSIVSTLNNEHYFDLGTLPLISFGENIRLMSADNRFVAYSQESNIDSVNFINLVDIENKVRHRFKIKIWNAPVAMSNDGRYLVIANKKVWYDSDGGWIVFDTKTKQTQRKQYEDLIVKNVQISSDNKMIAVYGKLYDEIALLDFPSLKVKYYLKGHQSVIKSFCFSNDGEMVVSASQDGTIRLWNTKTGAQIGAPFIGLTKDVEEVSISSDNRYVMATTSAYRRGEPDSVGDIIIWDTVTRKIVEEIKDIKGIRGCAFSCSGIPLLIGKYYTDCDLIPFPSYKTLMQQFLNSGGYYEN